MSAINFPIVPGTDKEYVDAFEAMKAEGVFVYEKATLGQMNEMPANEMQKNEGLQEVLAQGMRVFPSVTFRFPGNLNVAIQRQPDKDSLFDRVSVNRPDNADPIHFAKLVASLQKHLVSDRSGSPALAEKFSQSEL